MTITRTDEHWHSAWPDVVAFASVLFLAWWTQARATDLVWSLWLSSLVVGYAIILWAIVRPCAQVATAALHDRALVRQSLSETSPRIMLLAGTIGVIVALFVLAFFTVHFVGFHYVHAGFLSTFFPLDGDWGGAPAGPRALRRGAPSILGLSPRGFSGRALRVRAADGRCAADRRHDHAT